MSFGKKVMSLVEKFGVAAGLAFNPVGTSTYAAYEKAKQDAKAEPQQPSAPSL